MNYNEVTRIFDENYNLVSTEKTPVIWHEFLKKIGLRHTSFTRLEIENKKKWLLACIKYGYNI